MINRQATLEIARTAVVIEPDLAPVRGDIRQLTGLRGVAALDVVLTHYGIQQLPGVGLFGFGSFAVDLFFCLSSFTLCLVYGAGLRETLHLGSYAVARVARVYPLFIVTMLVTLWYSFVLRIGDFPDTSVRVLITQFVAQVTLLFEVPLPFVGAVGCWDGPAWSVSVEAVCYALAFPALFALTRRARQLTIDSTVLMTIVLSSLCFLAIARLYTHPVFGPWVPLIRGFSMFGAGWGAYLLYLQHRPAAIFFGSVTNTLAIGFLAVIAAQGYNLLPAVAVTMIAPFLVLGLMNSDSVTARFLASPPVHFLGVISYSLYLWHLPLRTISVHIWPWADDANLLHRMGFPLLVSLIVSTLSFYFLERPARRAIRRWGRSLPGQR